MQAVILAGGKGTRLRPFTTALPKPLVPVGEHPIIEVVLRQLKRHGFRDVVVSVGHLAGLIEAYCGDGRRWGLRVRYAREAKPLSTAGALRQVRGLERDFLTINGDVLTTLDFKALYARHRAAGVDATVAVCERATTVSFGVVHLGPDGLMSGFDEKPTLRYEVSMGVNVFRREALRLIRPGEALGIPDLLGRIRAGGGRVLGVRSRADWLDIGRHEDYEAAQTLFETPKGRAKYLR